MIKESLFNIRPTAVIKSPLLQRIGQMKPWKNKAIGAVAGAGIGAGIGALSSKRNLETGQKENISHNALVGGLVGGLAGGTGAHYLQKDILKAAPPLKSRPFVADTSAAEKMQNQKRSFIKKLFKKPEEKRIDISSPAHTQTGWRIKSKFVNVPGIQKFSSQKSNKLDFLKTAKIKWNINQVGSLTSNRMKTGALIGGGLLASPHIKDWLSKNEEITDPQKRKEFKNKAFRRAITHGLTGAVAGGALGELSYVTSPVKGGVSHLKRFMGFRGK